MGILGHWDSANLELFLKPNFKGFMADNAQVNWNAVKVVYGYGDATIKW